VVLLNGVAGAMEQLKKCSYWLISDDKGLGERKTMLNHLNFIKNSF
jgi:hypothetical protein